MAQLPQIQGFDYQAILNQTQNANEQIRQSRLSEALRARQRELQLEDESRALRQRQDQIKSDRQFAQDQEADRQSAARQNVILKSNLSQARDLGVTVDPNTGTFNPVEMIERKTLQENQALATADQQRLQAEANRDLTAAKTKYYQNGGSKSSRTVETPQQKIIRSQISTAIDRLSKLGENQREVRLLAKNFGYQGTQDISAATDFLNRLQRRNADSGINIDGFTEEDEKQYPREALVRADDGLLYQMFLKWAKGQDKEISEDNELEILNAYLSPMGL